jgi:hypothetical protein
MDWVRVKYMAAGSSRVKSAETQGIGGGVREVGNLGFERIMRTGPRSLPLSAENTNTQWECRTRGQLREDQSEVPYMAKPMWR